MVYSEENLMELLEQAFHKAASDREKGSCEGEVDHREEGHEHPDREDGREHTNHEDGSKEVVCKNNGDCRNCSYRGTEECPKVAGRSGREPGEGWHHDGEGHHGGEWHHGGEGHDGGEWQHGGEGHHGGEGWQHGGEGHHSGEHHKFMGRERILGIIAENGQISQNRLAEMLSIRPQSVSELLVKLEKDGYIVRAKNDDDKREILVSLTEEGKKRTEEVGKLRAAHASEFLSPLNEEERRTLFDLLSKLLSV